MVVPRFLDLVYYLEVDDRRYHQLAPWAVLTRFDWLMRRGQFEDVDAVLAAVDVARISTYTMRTLLSSTHGVKERLPSRPALFSRIGPALAAKRGEATAGRLIARLE